jgi:hypothetical protein
VPADMPKITVFAPRTRKPPPIRIHIERRLRASQVSDRLGDDKTEFDQQHMGIRGELDEHIIANSLIETRFVTRSRLVRTYLESLCCITPKPREGATLVIGRTSGVAPPPPTSNAHFERPDGF